MIYADYDYYEGTFYGSAVPRTDFLRLSRQASAYLDQVTFGRIDAYWAADVRVQDACCAVVEELYAQTQGGELVSAANDGYSETYAASGKTPEQRLQMAAARYLVMTGLLYQGV